jgi:hypothetical protein
MVIKWIKQGDYFKIDRDTLAIISDWAENICLYHFTSYEPDDMVELKETLDKVNKELVSYLKDKKTI